MTKIQKLNHLSAEVNRTFAEHGRGTIEYLTALLNYNLHTGRPTDRVEQLIKELK